MILKSFSFLANCSVYFPSLSPQANVTDEIPEPSGKCNRWNVLRLSKVLKPLKIQLFPPSWSNLQDILDFDGMNLLDI